MSSNIEDHAASTIENNFNCDSLSVWEGRDRDEIRRRRKERRNAKTIQKRLEKEQEKIVNLQPKSDKITILPRGQELPTYSQHNSKPAHIRKKKNTPKDVVNLLDYIVESKEQHPSILHPPKRDVPAKPEILLHKGKRREIPKKKHPRLLKRTILEWRHSKKQENLQETAENPEPCVQQEDVKGTDDDNLQTAPSEDYPQPLKTNQTNDEQHLGKQQETSIHSRKFRPYCNNTTPKDLRDLTESLLSDIYRFQKNAYQRKPLKAQAHKRYVVGFKEVLRQLAISKLKMIVIATDCEPCDKPGGIEDTIDKIKLECRERNILYVFSLRRLQLGYVLFKKVPVSCIGILSYDGAQETFKVLEQRIYEERNVYINLTTE